SKAIEENAIPGAQVLVAKEGKIFYQKSFGFHTYQKELPVTNTDLYDLASITKISTALAAFMKLKGEGKFDENETLGTYLPMARGSNKEQLVYRDILTHQAKLKSWISFWQATKRKNGSFRWFTMKNESCRTCRIPDADNPFILPDYRDKNYNESEKASINHIKFYEHCGRSFILVPEIVEASSGAKFGDHVRYKFYLPLGARTLTYNP